MPLACSIPSPSYKLPRSRMSVWSVMFCIRSSSPCHSAPVFVDADIVYMLCLPLTVLLLTCQCRLFQRPFLMLETLNYASQLFAWSFSSWYALLSSPGFLYFR